MARFSIHILCLILLLNLSGCSYVQSLFPDKEKDYQYTTEIPELVLPADLGKKPLKPLAVATVVPATEVVLENPAKLVEKPIERPEPANLGPEQKTTPEEIVSASETTVSEQTIDSPKISEQTPVKREIIPVELLKTETGAGKLRLDVPFEKAWRTIDKALSRKSIEVTSRKKEEKLFAVHYDHEEKKLEDTGLWDEFEFLFDGFRNNEKVFLLKLVENSQQTDVLALDLEQQPSTDANALNLLTTLQETIKSDFVKN